MARIDIVDLGKIKDTNIFMQYASKFASDVFKIVNGKLEFDANMLTQTVDVTFSAANTDTKVTHHLAKSGVRYLPCKKSVACDVYDGSGASTTGSLFLRCTQATTVTIILF